MNGGYTFIKHIGQMVKMVNTIPYLKVSLLRYDWRFDASSDYQPLLRTVEVLVGKE